MKILITGGHMTPALAVIQKLPKDAEVVYVGRKFALEGDGALSLEFQTVSEMNIPFISFQPGRLQRKFTRHTFTAFGRIPKGMWQAYKIVLQEKPDVILSFGGYVSFPICVAGFLRQIPIVLHEQTLEAGGANKIIARLATKICVSWESSLSFFPKNKIIRTGNPILPSHPSEDIQQLVKNISKKYPILTITGGSLGSHPINALIEPILEKLLAKYTIIHQTGDAQEYSDFSTLEKIRSSLPYTFQERYVLKKFIHPDDISFVYSHSDMVVSRSGINTVLTLLLLNTPALLIPLPVSQRQEQQKNALLFVASGLGEMLIQDKATSEQLRKSIENMMENKKQFVNKKRAEMLSLHSSAAEKIIEVVYDAKASCLQKKN